MNGSERDHTLATPAPVNPERIAGASAGLPTGSHPALRLFERFNQLQGAPVSGLADVYTEDVHFIDPAHEVHGLGALQRYFDNLYAGVLECRFDLQHQLLGARESALFWTMTLRHRALEGGRAVQVSGGSHLQHGERVSFHRDYFDLGALLYERVPLLGLAVGAVKRRLGA